MSGKRGFMSYFVTVDEKASSEVEPAPVGYTRMPGNLPKDESLDLEPPVQAAPVRSKTAMDWTLDEVMKAGGTEQGKNSADTVIKLKESLAAFPEVQQVAMVRALDAADDSWSEDAVKRDAQQRISVLEKYVGLVAQDEQSQVGAVNAEFQSVKQANDARVAELDAQIATLQAEREKTMQSTAAAMTAADERAKAVNTRAEGIRSSVTETIQKYRKLLTFFGV